MPTKSPEPVVAEAPGPGPKLVGPLAPIYCATLCELPVNSEAKAGETPGSRGGPPEVRKLSPVVLIVPWPIASTSGPNWAKVTIYVGCAVGMPPRGPGASTRQVQPPRRSAS